ncbi:MAG: hypothetical protein KC657_34325 [Myxococcales bacterium]|nr:hypothetical protein [Myxococcales bacterium]
MMLRESQPDAEDCTPPTRDVSPSLNPNHTSRHDSGFRPAMRTPDPGEELPHPADSEPATIHEMLSPTFESASSPADDQFDEVESTTAKFPVSESRRLASASSPDETDRVAPQSALPPPLPPRTAPPPPRARPTPVARPTPLAPSLSVSPPRASAPPVPAAPPAAPPSPQSSSSPGPVSAPFAAAPRATSAAPSQPSGVYSSSWPTPAPPPVHGAAAGFGGPTPSGTFTAAVPSSAPWPRPAVGAPATPTPGGTTLAVVALLAFVLGLTAGLAAGVAVGMRLL